MGIFVPNFFDRLREERERLALSQQALAEKCGVTARSQRNYESGERNPDSAYLAAIAAAGADVLYILTGQRAGGAPSVPALDAAEQVLLDSYRRCKPEARVNLIQTAALLSAGLPEAGKQAIRHRSGSGQTNVGDNAIQIGSVAGKARIKNR